MVGVIEGAYTSSLTMLCRCFCCKAFNDQPEVFNVSLLEDVQNPFAVHSSKAIGEPPFFLGSSVFYARTAALGKETYFEMRLPATSERIRLYANDEISMKAKKQMLGESERASSYQPQGSY
jgi:xanthine dehydrogenase molybdopterin-binding subunit B